MQLQPLDRAETAAAAAAARRPVVGEGRERERNPRVLLLSQVPAAASAMRGGGFTMSERRRPGENDERWVPVPRDALGGEESELYRRFCCFRSLTRDFLAMEYCIG